MSHDDDKFFTVGFSTEDLRSSAAQVPILKPEDIQPDIAPEHQKYLKRIEWVDVNTLKPSPHNTRLHSNKQIKLLCEGFQNFGVMTPILVDVHGEIIAGHGRYQAALRLGLKEVPVIVIRHLTEGSKRAYRIADNKLGDLSGFDEKALAIEIKNIIEIDVDPRITGLETVDIDLLIQSVEERPAGNAADDIPEPSSVALTRLGDRWIMDRHCLLCGDATSLTDCKSLVGDAKIRQVITDPPYGCAINGHVMGRGKVKHREFIMGAKDTTREEIEDLFRKAFTNIAAVVQPGCLVYAFIDFRRLYQMLTAGYATFTELKNIITWIKRNAGLGAHYRSATEFVTLWKHGTAAHTNNILMGTRRYRTNAWSYDGANSLRPGRDEELENHPTPKPVSMIADALLDSSNRGDAVLDLFAGGGTIFIAAEQTGRMAYAMELDPIYCDVAVRRWEKFTGKKAVLAETGQTFDEVAEVRNV